MNFEKICIIGIGLIGSSLAQAFKRHKIGKTIWGFDQDEVTAQVNQMQILDECFSLSAIPTVLPRADLVILATPINHILEILPEVARYTTPGALVTDVGSTKHKIVSVARALFQSDTIFLGGHPMAGSEKSGPAAGDPFLFENCYYVLTPTQDTPAVTAFSNILEKIGAKVLFLDAALHDRIAASVSHLPQILAVTLVNLLGKFQQENPYYLKMAAGGFRDMTRIASSPFKIWEDICKSNYVNILDLIENYITELQQIKQLFQNNGLNITQLNRYFETAARTRLSIPHDTKGFLNPLFDLTVVVRDEPGVIAQISATCYHKGINIRDIEVLKVRLWEGGTIRLAFETESDRTHAKQILEAKGFECHLKI